MEYFGPVVNSAAFLTARAHGGQIILSAAVHEKAKATELGQERKRMVSLGTFDMPDSPHGALLPPSTFSSRASHATLTPPCARYSR
jgi:hypothetical protein